MLNRDAVIAVAARILGGQKHQAPPAIARKTLTRQDVSDIYLELLHRPPESEATVNLHYMAHETPEGFRESLRGSEEYRQIQSFSKGRKVSLADLDAEIDHLAALAQSDATAFHEHMSDFWLDLPPCSAPVGSPDYAQWVLHSYAAIANRSYEQKSEVTSFDIDAMAKLPYPYNTRNARTIGDQLMAVGHVIHSMNLQPGSHVLEFGFGWGTTTLQLALSGYGVTGIDIAPNFVELVRRRAQALSVDVDVKVGTFFDIESMDQQVDAVLFFEAFHHCSDHVRLLKAIPRVLKPGGKLVLAGETINNALPYPWGINPDGQAVYCIRQFGWLELSFREDYVLPLLDELGWKVTKHPFSNAAGITYVAERR